MVIPAKLSCSTCHSVSSVRNYQDLQESIKERYHVKKKGDCKMWMKRSDLAYKREDSELARLTATTEEDINRKKKICFVTVGLLSPT